MREFIKSPSLMALLFLLLPAGLSAQEFDVFDLDSNGQAALAAAFRIAENGTSAGLAVPLSGGYEHAAVWTAAGTVLLPHLPGDEASVAKDVSEQGVVAGESDDVIDLGHILKIYPHATLWLQGQPVDLSTMVTGGDDLELFEAVRINELGLILGRGRDAAIPALRSFLFEDGIITDLGSLAAGGNSEPFDMNEQGHVVGSAQAPNNFDHAFLWKDGTMFDLHDPMVVLGRNSTARAINEFGVIAGSADFVDDFIDFETATIWDHGVITNLGTLAGNQSYARDINDHGIVVGTSTVAGGGVHAFIYQGDVLTDLNDLIPPNTGWTLANAHAVSNDGRIVGEGFFNGALRAYLLVPDCEGGFEIYGAGCAGSGGYVPALYGHGCPIANGEVSLVVVNGLGGGPGLLLFGSGFGTVPFKPGCDIQILPLLPVQVPLSLQGTGPGAGVIQIESQLPSNLVPVLITLQALLMDPQGPGGFTVTNPLAMDIK